MSEVSATETVETPVVETPAPTTPPVAEVKKASPAQDLRDIQYLLLNGIFPGNVAPAVVKAYQMLEQMSLQIEKSANESK